MGNSIMIKNIGIIFSGLLILLLLSNIHYNSSVQVLAQNNTLTTNNNNTETAVSPSATTPPTTNTNTDADATTSASSISKLAGGIKINSPDKGDLVPLNSNKSLVIYGVSKDTASTDCDVTIIVNNVKPYQNVQPTGIQGNNDYSTWQYTLSSNYTSINEGNNKITSKIYCAADNGNGNGTTGSVALPPQPSQAYYSVNITASNFTQAQLTNYELMLESASNSTNGNSTPASNAIQPVAQIQQFNQDTGSGPVCCTTVGGTIPGQTAGTTPTAAALADDTSEVATEEEEVEEETTEEEDNNRNDDEQEEESNNNDNEDNDNDNDNNDSSRDIMDEVEDTMRESGIDFSFGD
jgi:hypothetical protein